MLVIRRAEFIGVNALKLDGISTGRRCGLQEKTGLVWIALESLREFRYDF
jgi:hypothetical protein